MPLWTPVNVFLICCSIEESILTRVLTALGYNDWFSFLLVGECMGMRGLWHFIFVIWDLSRYISTFYLAAVWMNSMPVFWKPTIFYRPLVKHSFYSWFSTFAGESKMGLEKSQLIFITWNNKFTFPLLLMNVGKLMLLTWKCLESESLR